MIVFVKRGQWSFNRSLKSVLYILVKHNSLNARMLFSWKLFHASCKHPLLQRVVNAGPLYSPINGYISVTQKLPYPLADTVCVFKPYCCRHVNDCIRLKYGAV